MTEIPPKNEVKQIIKEVVKEVIDEAFSSFGRWSMRALFTVAAGGVIYIYILLQLKGHK